MTQEEFVNNEIRIWGFDYIEDLFNKGYEPVLLVDNHNNEKWSWVYSTPVLAYSKR